MNRFAKLILTTFALFFVAFLCLTIILVIRCSMFADDHFIQYNQLAEEPSEMIPDNNGRKLRYANKFAQTLRIATVSRTQGDFNAYEMLQLHELLEKNYPVVHNSPYVKVETVNSYSILFTITGTSDDGTVSPYLLISHLDVVPPGEVHKWTHGGPFSGLIINGTDIYGRGAADAKYSVAGILEALEYYLSAGNIPKRTFFIVFGHDEEVGGYDGANAVAKLLMERGIHKLEFILDEGLGIISGFLPSTDKRIAMIGICEKGRLDLELTVESVAGHSSTPPTETAIGILATAVSRLEAHPLPSLFGLGPEVVTLEYITPYVSYWNQLLYTNLWLSKHIVARSLTCYPMGNALVRTTTAVTIFNGGFKINVIPLLAKASVNHRVHPLEDKTIVLDHDIQVIGDQRVNITVKRYRSPSPIADHGTNSFGFMVVATSINQIFPEVIVAPGMMVANTDSRWFHHFTHNIYRFAPKDTNYDNTVGGGPHTYNEKHTIDGYFKGVNFYYRIIKNAEILTTN